MKLFTFALVCVCVATVAHARSNMETTVIRDMRRDGVPEECVAKLTTNDAAMINSWKHDPEMSSGSKNRSIKNQYRKICER